LKLKKEGGENMKNRWLIVIGMVLLASIVVGLAGCATDNRINTGSNNQQTGLWVSGTGKVYVTPDIAELTLGVEAQAATVAEAQSIANQTMNAVIAAIKTEGITEDDIQTQYFNITEVTKWDYDKGESSIIGYMVTNTVLAKIRDIDKTGDVIDAAVAAGGDYIRINSLNFTVEDPNIYYAQAREQAITYAIQKAEQMAALTGVNLGDITYIAESSYMPSGNYYEGRALTPTADSGSTSVSPGQLEVTTTVTIVYNIEN
jgi:uncharacterized protein YggE